MYASSGIPASYLTCGSSIIQVMLASFKYLLEHKVLKNVSLIYNSSSNNCLPYVFIQDIVIAKSKKVAYVSFSHGIRIVTNGFLTV